RSQLDLPALAANIGEGQTSLAAVLLTGQFGLAQEFDPTQLGRAEWQRHPICRNALGGLGLYLLGDRDGFTKALDLAQRQLQQSLNAKDGPSGNLVNTSALLEGRECTVIALAGAGEVARALELSRSAGDLRAFDNHVLDIVVLVARAGNFA